jgi:hypothetical protein
MPLFWKPYRSDVTQLIDDLKTKNPRLEADQREGRSRLWDRPLNREEWQGYQAGRVPQKPYVYQAEPTLAPPR